MDVVLGVANRRPSGPVGVAASGQVGAAHHSVATSLSDRSSGAVRTSCHTDVASTFTAGSGAFSWAMSGRSRADRAVASGSRGRLVPSVIPRPLAVPLACHNEPVQDEFGTTRRIVDVPSHLLFRVSVLPRPGLRAAF